MCKVLIPGLDAYKCDSCGWVATEYKIGCLKKMLEERTSEKESKAKTDLLKLIKSEEIKRTRCQVSD
jgi:hypothetical protein